MAVRHGSASFPGVPAAAVLSCSYTASHGVSPGVAVLRCAPFGQLPAVKVGSLTITDGVGKVTLVGCLLSGMKVEWSEAGQVWCLEILDRRWRWRNREAVEGWYNQQDPRAKLIPWTVRSPTELAARCFAALGETPALIDLPPGLASADVAGLLAVVPVTGTNPPTNWVTSPAAEALAALCDQYGRRVVYDPVTDTVGVCVPGRGAALPRQGLSVGRYTESLAPADRPSEVRVVGDPTRFQARFDLEAVGRDWDGLYRPIDQLSYAPEYAAVRHAYTVKANDWQAGATWTVSVSGQGVVASPGAGTAAAVVESWRDKINAATSDEVLNKVQATASGDTLTITGRRPGDMFAVQATVSDTPATPKSTVSVTLTQTGRKAGKGWKYSTPGFYADVKATERLTWQQAQDLARETVFRCYRITGLDPNLAIRGGRRPMMTIPGYGPILRPQQIVPQDTQVDQIVPETLDFNVTDRSGQPVVVDFYNGLSRDKAAAVYGQALMTAQNGRYLRAFRAGNQHNEPGTRVMTSVSIDSFYRVCTFDSYVYYAETGDGVRPAEIALQTACNIRDPDTNQLVCFARSRAIPGGAGPPMVVKKPDVQLNVTSTYDESNRILTTSLLEIDAVNRADYYLDAIQAGFVDAVGQTVLYNGIVPVPLDGRVQQVTWAVGDGGATTEASADGEHSLYVPPFAQRRRAEYVAAAVFTLGEDPRRRAVPQNPQ